MRDEVKSGIILSICVILIIVIVYFTTAVFMTGEIGNKKVSKTNNTTESSKTSSSNETSIQISPDRIIEIKPLTCWMKLIWLYFSQKRTLVNLYLQL